MYNRCHLLGFQLTGENANKLNLITGTRQLNVDAMLPFENMIADYVKSSNNHVYFRVTPIFEGNNLLASGLLMEAKSVEDSGDGILFNVYCYNVQDGISINYVDGTSSSIVGNVITDTTSSTTSSSSSTNSTSSSTSTVTTPSTSTSSSTTDSGTVTGDTSARYVLNTNTKNFHVSSCRYVATMNAGNTEYSSKTTAEIRAMGYEACKVCKP